MQMKVFFDGDHYVIASDPNDADQVLEELHHPDKAELQKEWGDDEPLFKPWEEIPGHKDVGPIYGECMTKNGLRIMGHVEGPVEAWVSDMARGMIGSRECCNGY